MIDVLPYEFRAPIVQQHMGRDLYYAVVFLPSDLARHLPFDQFPRLRVNAEVSGVPVEGTFMPVRGAWYLMTPRKLMSRIGAQLGDEVTVRFAVADQDAVNVPPALAEALADDPAAKAVWESWTPGKRRGFAHRVASAKTDPTIRKRVDEVLAVLAEG